MLLVLAQVKNTTKPKTQENSEVEKTMKELEKIMEQMDPESKKNDAAADTTASGST